MAADASKYDLTSELGKYLDRHLVFPLLEFLQAKKVYPEAEILEAKIALLQKTNMLDFAADIYKSLHNGKDVPAEMAKRREEVIANLTELQAKAEKVVTFLSDPALVKQLRTDKAFNINFLKENHGIGEEDIDALFHYAKFQFECGNYAAAAEFLYHYRSLCTNGEKGGSALWGKFASDILQQDWNAAVEDMNRLKDAVENRNYPSPLAQVHARAWLIHWSLFVFFNHENGRNSIIDLFFQERYMQSIQAEAPHLLRYLAAAVITNKRRRSMLKDLVRVLRNEHVRRPHHRVLGVPLRRLRLRRRREQKLAAVRRGSRENDFLLRRDAGRSSPRTRGLFIFETYCRIHQCIDINRARGASWAWTSDSAERWIVNLIRSTKLNAKIDSEAGTVVMGSEAPSIHELVVEKTKAITGKTYALTHAVLSNTQGAIV
jgi:translation initiation factor 3 subunit E